MKLFHYLLPCIIGFSAMTAYADSSFTPAQEAQIQKMIQNYLSDPDHLVQIAANINKAIASKQQDTTKQAVTANSKQLFFASNSLVAGNPDGKINVVEFLDYLCPYCKSEAPVLAKMAKDNKNIRLVFKQLLIHGAPAEFAAKAAIASNKQNKFWPFHLAMLNYQGDLTQDAVLKLAKQSGLDVSKLKADMNNEDVANQLKADAELADALNVNSTPTIIIANVTPAQNSQTEPVINKVVVPDNPSEEALVKATEDVK